MTDAESEEVLREASEYVRRTSFTEDTPSKQESDHEAFTHTHHAEYGAAAH